MANEFTRKETVADYQTYAGQKDSQIDFSAEADKITTAVKKVATDRETKKKKIQTETDDILTQLAKAETYSSQTVQQTVLMQANNMKRDVLQFYKDVKIGKRKLADYQAYMQTSRDSIIKSGIAAKHWEENFIEQEARQKLGEDGIKIASGTETYISLNVFGDNVLKNAVPYQSPSGEGFLVTMNVDENGTKTMPDFDTERHKYKPASSMQLWQTYQDDGNKYDIASLVKKSNANIGTFITSKISGYTTAAGGGVVMTREGAQQMDEYLNTTDGKKAFDLLMEETVAVVLSSDLSVANALEQRSKAGPGKYIIAQTEKEFREKGGTDLSKFLRIVATDKPPTYPDLTEEQRNVAEGMVEREFLTQLGQSTKNTKGLSGQTPSAANVTSGVALQERKALSIDIMQAVNDFRGATTAQEMTTVKERLLNYNPNIQGFSEITETVGGKEIVTAMEIIYNDGSPSETLTFGVVTEGVFEETPAKEYMKTGYGKFAPSGGIGANAALGNWGEENITESYNSTAGLRVIGENKYEGISTIAELGPDGKPILLSRVMLAAEDGAAIKVAAQSILDNIIAEFNVPSDLFTVEVTDTGGSDRIIIRDQDGKVVLNQEEDDTNAANTLEALDKLIRDWTNRTESTEETTETEEVDYEQK